MIRFNQFLTEGGASGHMAHLFEDGNLSFGELRTVFSELFKGEVMISEKTDGQALAITYKDGEFGVARNKTSLKDPMTIKKLSSMFEGRGELKKAFVNSMNDLSKALSSLSKQELTRFFDNGKNFMAFEIIYPPTKNVIDYGDRCLLQLHGINIYDDKYNKVSEDKQAAEDLFETLKNHKALKQATFEITGPAILKIKNSISAKKALNIILEDLDKLVDGIGYKATINDYVKVRYIKKIINAATKANLDLDRQSEFVSNLADRLSKVSGKKPSKADLAYLAKKADLNPRTDEYKEFLNRIENMADDDNTEIIKPIENLIIKAGMLLIKNLQGFVAADRSKSAKELSRELDAGLHELEAIQKDMEPGKLARMERNLVKLQDFDKQVSGIEGIVFLYKGKPYKMTGTFGSINALLGLIKYQ